MSKKLPANYALRDPSTYSYKLTYNNVVRMSFYKGILFLQEVL